MGEKLGGLYLLCEKDSSVKCYNKAARLCIIERGNQINSYLACTNE